MTLQDAANVATVAKAQQDILHDPSMDLQTKIKTLGAIQNAAATKPPSQPWLTMGNVVDGAIGAGLGAGAGYVLGKFLGVSPDTLSTMRTIGMGFGTLLNMGKIAMTKTAAVEQERRDAFRYAFVKEALELNLIELLELPIYKAAAASFVSALPLTPELISAPVDAGISLGNNVASNAGALAGSLTAPDSTDERMTKMLLARRALEGQASDIESTRKQTLLKQILAKRTQH